MLLCLLLLLLLLLPPLAMLWQQRSEDPRLSWLTNLRHQMAWVGLGWAAAWQQRRLEQSTLHAGQSQQRALVWCLQGQGLRCPPGGNTDVNTFRNHLPLTKANPDQEEESKGQFLAPASLQYHGEASLQATLLGLVALNKAYPEVLAPGGTACLTLTSPWPYPLPWLGHALGRVSPSGAKDPRTLLLEALRSSGLRALEAGTAVELLDIFMGLEAEGTELAEAVAAGNPGAPLPRRAAEIQEALEQGARGLALRLWPQLQVVVTLDAGGQAEAVAALEALWCQGLAFFSPAYIAFGGQLDVGLVGRGQETEEVQPLIYIESHTLVFPNPPQRPGLCARLTDGQRLTQTPIGTKLDSRLWSLHNHCAFYLFPDTARRERAERRGCEPRGCGEDTAVGSDAQKSQAWDPRGHIASCCHPEGSNAPPGCPQGSALFPTGVVGLNLWPEKTQGLYLLPPGAPFIELLPVGEGTQEEAASTLLLVEAQTDKEYELVLTDHTSLTRCRLGDVVQVVGIYNQCPVVRFTYRLGQALSVRGEVTSEKVFSEALAQAVGQWPGAKLLDHSCVESHILDSCAGAAPHYEVFVDLRGLRNLSEENREKLDHCLQEISPHYKSLRFRGSVGSARVHLVRPGAFRVLREALAASPSSSFPPEMPRVLRHKHLAQLLQRRAVS